MVWARIDDHYTTHPKLNAAGPLAIAVDVAGICYCALNLTDGYIPETALSILLNMPITQIRKQVARLIEVGRWETKEGGYLVHDFLDYNPSAEEVLGKRQKEADRKAEWRERRKPLSQGSPKNVPPNVPPDVPPNVPPIVPPLSRPSRTPSPGYHENIYI